MNAKSAALNGLERDMTDELTTEEKRDLRYVAMDIKLFLRLASTHFPPRGSQRDVLMKLDDLADQYGAGVNIWKQGVLQGELK